MRIAFSKKEVELICDALKYYPYDMLQERKTYELEPSPFSKEKQQEYIKICNDKIDFNNKILFKLDKKLREWK